MAFSVIQQEFHSAAANVYDKPNWRDQLTAMDGVPITYDAIGNPLYDGEWTYTWQNGRQLARMQKVGVDASFIYNENGLRVQKTVNGVVTNYTLHGKNVVHMTQGSDELHFFYDASNKPSVVVFNGMPYSYIKNLQGDIVAILNSAGAPVVNYVYDAWGRPISCSGTMASSLGKFNPFRYRGYVYDEETGLHYLRSRYYQNTWGRFLNCDTLLGTLGTIFASNLWTYCDNNTINAIDSDGFEATLVQPFATRKILGTKDGCNGGGGIVIAGISWISKTWSRIVSASAQITLLLFPTAAYVSELVDVDEVAASTEQATTTPRPETGKYWLAYAANDGMPILVGEPMTYSEAVRLIDTGRVLKKLRTLPGIKKGYNPHAYGIYTPDKSDACRLADRFTNTRVDMEVDKPSHLPHFHCAKDNNLHIWFSR